MEFDRFGGKVERGGLIKNKKNPPSQSSPLVASGTRIDFKIALLTYRSLNGFARQYLVDVLEVQESCRALRSNKKNRLKLPMTRTKRLGTGASTNAAPAV